MIRNILIIFLTGLCLTAFASANEPNEATVENREMTFPLREGFPVKGIDGKLHYDKADDVWKFQLSNDLTDGFGIIKSGQKVQLLKSSMLDKIVDVHRNQDVNEFRIWATTVTYRGDNSFYPIYFLALEKQKDKPEKDQASEQVPDANDESILPEDVMKKLEPARAVTTAQVSEALASESDTVLINRTGFVFYDRIADGYVFKLDALGRNINNTTFILHKSRALSFLRSHQRTTASPMRFKVSGRITTFKGKRYILMHKAIPANSYGNFGR